MMLCRWAAAAWLLWAGACSAQTSDDSTSATIVHAPVEYPASARSARDEGTVYVSGEVDASGHAVGMQIDRSSGHANLDAAALKSISNWAFLPAMRNGQPVAQRVIVPVRFQLENSVYALGSTATVTGSILYGLGSLIWMVGIVWSIVLAKRKSIMWLSFMVALWIITYPLFVAKNWSTSKRNLGVVSLGVALFCFGLYLLPS